MEHHTSQTRQGTRMFPQGSSDPSMQNRMWLTIEKLNFLTDEFSCDAYSVLPGGAAPADIAMCMRNSFDEWKDIVVMHQQTKPFSACALRVSVLSVVNAITGTANTDNWLHCSRHAPFPLASSFSQHAPSICLYLSVCVSNRSSAIPRVPLQCDSDSHTCA